MQVREIFVFRQRGLGVSIIIAVASVGGTPSAGRLRPVGLSIYYTTDYTGTYLCPRHWVSQEHG